jgi:predicted metal-dependent HD superfamily phosphohydrolase
MHSLNEVNMVDESPSIALGERFRALWVRCLLPGVTMDPNPVYEDLVRLYSESGRRYHSWGHLTHCLQEFDRGIAAQMGSPDAVELALWFHDAIYAPGAADNEQRSSDLFRQWGRIGFSPAFVEKVCGLILITMHRQSPDEGDESYVMDIDLSSFGMNWPDFLRDTRDIRKEQAHVPDAVYYPTHARFLKLLLNRPCIFHTDFFHDSYEKSARRNIERLLSTSLYTRELSERS